MIPVEAEVVIKIRILVFARLREILRASELSLPLPEGACAGDAWRALLREHPALACERDSTRVARNGRIVAFDEALVDGDEVALLPPVSGG